VKEIFDEEGGCHGETVCVDGCSKGCRCQKIEEAGMVKACGEAESPETRFP
jgi:hypothetical protein